MPEHRLSRESVEQFRGILREWKGVELSYEDAESAATDLVLGIRAAAATDADFNMRGATYTPEEFAARAEELFPGHAERGRRRFRFGERPA